MTSGNTIYMAEAGPVPHDPADGKVVSFKPKSPSATEVASGAERAVPVHLHEAAGVRRRRSTGKTATEAALRGCAQRCLLGLRAALYPPRDMVQLTGEGLIYEVTASGGYEDCIGMLADELADLVDEPFVRLVDPHEAGAAAPAD